LKRPIGDRPSIKTPAKFSQPGLTVTGQWPGKGIDPVSRQAINTEWSVLILRYLDSAVFYTFHLDPPDFSQ
jgi:hypothetical protein